MHADSADTSFFSDVDNANRNERLLAAMDATAAWPAVKQLRAFTEPAITDGASLLDVGCGLADIAIDIAARHPEIAIIGVDSSSEMLAVAAERADAAGVDITLRQGDATSLPFDDGAFDAVRCERVLQWLDEPEAVVAELARVTAPGGAVVLLDSDWRTFATTSTRRDIEVRLVGPSPSRHVGTFLASYARAAGLTDVEQMAVAHRAHHIAGDASDGMWPYDQFAQLQIDSGMDADDVEQYLDELRHQDVAGELTWSVTMWAVVGRALRTD